MKTIVLIILIVLLLVSCGDNNGNTPQKDLCKDVTCSDNGICKIVNNKAVCDCDEGFEAYNLNCFKKCSENEHPENNGKCVSNIKTVKCTDNAPENATSDINETTINWDNTGNKWESIPQCNWFCNENFKEDNNMCICEDTITKTNNNVSMSSAYEIPYDKVIKARTSKRSNNSCNYMEDWYKITSLWGYDIFPNIKYLSEQHLKIELYDANGTFIDRSSIDNTSDDGYKKEYIRYQHGFNYSSETVYIVIKGEGVIDYELSVIKRCNGSLVENAILNRCIPNKCSFDGKYIHCWDIMKTWNKAKEFCEAMNTHIVTVNNAEENALIGEKAYDYSWIGYYENGNSWKWVYGNSVYNNWMSGEPGNAHNLCAQVSSSTNGLLWSSISCDIENHVICEKE